MLKSRKPVNAGSQDGKRGKCTVNGIAPSPSVSAIRYSLPCHFPSSAGWLPSVASPSQHCHRGSILDGMGPGSAGSPECREGSFIAPTEGVLLKIGANRNSFSIIERHDKVNNGSIICFHPRGAKQWKLKLGGRTVVIWEYYILGKWTCLKTPILKFFESFLDVYPQIIDINRSIKNIQIQDRAKTSRWRQAEREDWTFFI